MVDMARSSSTTVSLFSDSSQRLDWVDALRAIAIMLVVFGHCAPGAKAFFVWTSPVKIPLFFFISGFLFKDDRTFNSFLKNRFHRIIIPWLFLGIIPGLLFIPVRGFGSFLKYCVDVIDGTSLWFMPCFVIGEVIHFFLRRIAKNEPLFVLVTLLLSITGYLLIEHHFLDVAMINRALSVQLFFTGGFLIRRHGVFLHKYFKIIVFSSFILYTGLTFLNSYVAGGDSIDVHLGRYSQIYFNIPIIAFGCTSLFLVFQNISIIPKWFLFIGKNTLIIYILHDWFILFLTKTLIHLGVPKELPEFCLSLISFLWGISLCCVVSLLINKYCPFLIGGRK